MTETATLDVTAEALLSSVGAVIRRIRQLPSGGGLSLPERQALSLLARCGPATSAELARLEQMTPQSMGATLARLQSQHLIERAPDPRDGRRVTLSVTAAGHDLLRQRRDVNTERVVQALSTGFTDDELAQLSAIAPLIDRLANNLR